MLQRAEGKSWSFLRTVVSSVSVTALQQLENSPQSERVTAFWPTRLGRIAPCPSVEVGPGDFIRNEALQEHRGDNGARHRRRRRVGKVGDIALEQFVIGIPQRHAP